MIRLDAVSAAVPGAAAQDAPRFILRDVTADFRPGESHLVLGPNGSGKTTLIRLLAGFHAPASGQVFLDGAPIARGRDAPSLWPRVAVLFEEPDPQFLTDSVEAEIAFGLESLACPPDKIRARTAEALEAYGLSGFEARAPHTLSAGEKARTLLAAVMAARPQVLLLDQSLAHLDPSARRELEERLMRDVAERDLALVRTHQDADPPYPGERLRVMERGALIDASGLSPRALPDADPVPLPLAMRVSALLAAHGLWDGPLELRIAGLKAGLRAGHAAALDGGAPTPEEEIPPRPDPSRTPRREALAFHDVAVASRGPGASRALIRGVTLEVGEGEVVALMGKSGTGKSTILKVASGLVAPASGSIRHADAGSGRRPRAALALEYPERQLFGRTVEEDVEATLWVAGLERGERQRRGHEALEAVGLDPDLFRARVPITLSEGEKRRVAIASLLADAPRVVLLDEPTAGLDPEGRRALARVVRGLGARGHAVLMASHDADFVSGVADRIVVLGREGQEPGTILGAGSPPALWSDRGLLERASLPSPDFVSAERALRAPGIPAFGPARDAESLLDALSRALARKENSGCARQSS